MNLKYVDSFIKELRYENSLNYTEELSQKNNIQMNLGIDNDRKTLYLEINADVKTSNSNSITNRQIDLTILYFFEIEDPINKELDNIDLYKSKLEKDLPIYFNMFDDTVKRITNLDYSTPISIINSNFDYKDFVEK